jgi:hypothetical protein
MNNVFNSHRPVRHCHVYRTLTRMLTVGTLLGSGLVAHAMQQRFNPNTGALMASQAQPSNVTCNVNPGSISARQPTNVNISLAANTNANTTARMAASMPATLFLGRPSGNRYTALGAFTAHPQEQGVVYNITVTINEPEQTTIQFAVSSNPDSGRYVAVPCRLAVGPPSQGSNGNNNGHGNQGSGWGGFLGQVIGGIINNKGGNNPQPTPFPTPVTEPTPNPWPTPRVNVRSASANGLTFRYPDNWNYHQEVVNQGGPINLRNFDNYQYGGVVPNGGATIDITSSPLTGTGLAAMAQSELGALSSQNLRVDDHPAVLMDYSDAFAPGLDYENEAVYVQAGSKVYKFFLSYRSGDPNGGNFVQDFQKVVSSTRFTANN